MKYLIIISALFLFFSSCEDEQLTPVVITENVLYVSGEIVRLSGRIYENGGKEASEHGFEISKNADFNSVDVNINLGSINSLGQFFGSDSTLISKSDYYFRAYAVINSTIYHGKEKQFRTLSPLLNTFNPKIAYANDIIKIIGANFSSDTKIFFGDTEAEIIEIKLESIIKVKVPEIGNSVLVDIKVIIAGNTEVFDMPFEYIIGEWKNIGEFVNDDQFFNGITIQNDNEIICGLGGRTNGSTYNQVWKLDAQTWTWENVNFIGTAVKAAYFNQSGILGGGGTFWTSEGGEYIANNQMWQYKNGLFVQLANGPMLYGAVSILINEESYLIGGFKLDGKIEKISETLSVSNAIKSNRTVYKYNDTDQIWEIYGNAPFDFNSNLISFTHNQYSYFINKSSDLWRYDAQLNSWFKLNSTPFQISDNGFAEVLGNNKVIVAGIYNDRRAWEYSVESDSWKSKYQFPGEVSFGNSMHFNYNSKIYVIRAKKSYSSTASPMEIWEFDPYKF
jgi:hypothetical protein